MSLKDDNHEGHEVTRRSSLARYFVSFVGMILVSYIHCLERRTNPMYSVDLPKTAVL